MKIPVVFAFDDNYALPASVAIMSLLNTKSPSTEYEIIVLHGGLRQETMSKFNLICPIRWVKVDRENFRTFPTGWSGEESWYRLMMADLLPQYDKLIWSDADVLFKADISAPFMMNMHDVDWAGVKMELPEEVNGIHNHFPESNGRPVYTPCFMVVNSEKWRREGFLEKCKKCVKQYGKRLTFYDLDVLNIVAQSIVDVSLKYSVFAGLIESNKIEDASEYPWLSRAHGRAGIVDAVENPIVIHYAGCGAKLKPWERGPKNIPDDYWQYLSKSPFYNHRYYFPRMGPMLLWAFDSIKYLVLRRSGKALARRRVSHWENMVSADYPQVYRAIQNLKAMFRKLVYGR